MGLNLTPWRKPAVVERSSQALSFDDWSAFVSSFQFAGAQYTLPGASQEDIGSSFSGLARGGFKGNGVVFACVANRLDLFAEARFLYRRTRGGRPGDMFDYRGSDLEVLRSPWEGGTTGDLLSRMLLHADIAGNAYVVRRAGRLTPLRPDWVTIIGGVPGEADASVWHPDARVLGYAYQEGGPALGKEPMFFLSDEVAHFAYRPDPEARFRGMSWLTPIVREIMSDKAMTDHKLAFFENGATPNLVVKLNVDTLDKFKAWMEEFKSKHQGSRNAYETMFLGAGADASVVGADMRQLDFKITQGAAETRIAAAAGVPPVIVGLSEGLAAATYSNYASARRRFADQTMRPLWRNVAGSLARIIQVPSDAELWYDDRDIQALQEDQKDAADIFLVKAQAYRTLVDGGVKPESAAAAVASGDITSVDHSGLLSVQLQEPGAKPPGSDAPAEPPVKRQDPLDMLEDELMRMLRDRDERAINVNVQTPDVNVDVHPAAVTVEPAHVTVEPQRWEEGAIQVHVAPAATPDVNVTVEPAQITVESPRFEDGSIQVSVEAAPAPDVNVTVESPQVTVERAKARRVDFGDGRVATVTEGEQKHIRFEDGRELTVTDVEDAE